VSDYPADTASDAGAWDVRIPPQDLEAERALLGSMLQDARAVSEALVVLPADQYEAFYVPAHRTVFQALCAMRDAGQPVDLVTFKRHLRDRGQLDEVGGEDFILTLAESVPSWIHARHYAEIVEQAAWKRKAILGAGRILDLAYQPGEFGEVREQIERESFRLAERRQVLEQATIGEMLDAMFAEMNTEGPAGLTGVPTGFPQIDEWTGGLQPGEFVVVGARPSMGKSAWGFQVACYAAEAGHPAGLWSLEMDRRSVIQRLACMLGGVNSQALRRRTLSDGDWRNLRDAEGRLRAIQRALFIDDQPGISLMDLRSRIRNRRERDGIKLAVIDYVQLIRHHVKGRSRENEVSEISSGLKGLARELRIPVVVLAQLNRNVEGRTDFRPRMSDLRESGSLEQDADCVLLIHREEYYHKGDTHWIDSHPERIGAAELILEKNRNGPTGSSTVAWQAQYTRFAPWMGPVTGAAAEPETTTEPWVPRSEAVESEPEPEPAAAGNDEGLF
jgi:replicative DNA helicase